MMPAESSMVMTHNRNMRRVDYGALSSSELLSVCLEPNPESWQEFFRRYQPLIASTVIKSAHRRGMTSPARIEDLIQEVYLKLISNDYRLLRNFVPRDESSLAKYLAVTASSVVQDFFRGASVEKPDITIDDAARIHALESSPGSDAKRFFVTEEIDRHLKAKSSDTSSERDRTIFWLFYRQGFTAEAIAAMPSIALTTRVVENILLRLTRYVRSQIAAKRKSSGPE